MISNVEAQIIVYDVIISDVFSNAEVTQILSEVDDDYRNPIYRITDENELRITENEEPRII
jgi:hypothetical protein